MSAITISREIGSQGDWIANEAAQRLGYRLVDKYVLEKIFVQYGMVKFHETYEASSFWSRFNTDVKEMVILLNKVNMALAAHRGVVLVGRGGFAMLKNCIDVLNVRVLAPRGVRVEQVMRDEKLTDRLKAEKIVDDSDRARQNFLEAAYGKFWNATDSFDLVIDTSKINTELAIEWIVDTTIRISHLEKKGKISTRNLDIDPMVVSSVNEVFEQMHWDE